MHQIEERWNVDRIKKKKAKFNNKFFYSNHFAEIRKMDFALKRFNDLCWLSI